MTEPAPAPQRSGVAGTAVLGAILVAVGVVFLVVQLVDVQLAVELWPFYVIVPGLVLAAIGLTQRGAPGVTLAGTMVAVVGAVLLYQEWADHYESWAYAWALVAPGGSGLGLLVHGAMHRDAKMTRDGFWQMVIGVGLFAVGLAFFEGVIGLGGDPLDLPAWLVPAVLIGAGVVVLARAVSGGRRAAGP